MRLKVGRRSLSLTNIGLGRLISAKSSEVSYVLPARIVCRVRRYGLLLPVLIPLHFRNLSCDGREDDGQLVGAASVAASTSATVVPSTVRGK